MKIFLPAFVVLAALLIINSFQSSFAINQNNTLLPGEKDATINPDYVIFEDDFETYTVGEQLACQNPDDWTTWSNTPCGSEDAYISDDVAHSGINSIIIESGNDLVKDYGNYYSGGYLISFYIYIPDGYFGYFNTLQDFNGTSSEWGMQVYFDNGGAGLVDAGGAGTGTFTYSYDTWILNEINVDLDEDWAVYSVDGTVIVEWQWSTGTFGTGTLNQLGGTNFYGWDENGSAKYYIDDVILDIEWYIPYPFNLEGEDIGCEVALSWDTISGVSGTFQYYNIYRNGEDIADVTTESYNDTDVNTGTYQYYVTAVYDIGESLPSNVITLNVECVFSLPAPENLHMSSFEDCVFELCWDPPPILDVWIRWDAGTNTGNGIGTNGELFYCASRWVPPDLANYNNTYLTKIAFWNNGDPDAEFTIMVWEGENAATVLHSQYVGYATPDEWTEIILDDPVQINADEEFWIGYGVSSPTVGTWPAGCDDGPAIQYRGDMISLDGTSWVSMSADYGLDYNWNLAGFVTSVPGEQESAVMNKPSSIVSEGNFKSLLGYNIYKNGSFFGFTTQGCFTDTLQNFSPQTYCVTAVYDIGESDCSNEITVWGPCGTLYPPQNLETQYPGYGIGVPLTWEEPDMGEWIRWDAGINYGNGIGLANGGVFNCASRWMPSELIDYDGQFLTKISFWNNSDPDATFKVRVWVGENASTLLVDQVVSIANPDEWTEVDLDNPVLIDASQELWFGYEVTQGPGGYPAGCDDGPAIQYSGDMFSDNGIIWASMSAEYGLDYNWNIGGFVSPFGDGSSAQPLIKENVLLNITSSVASALESGVASGISVEFIPSKAFIEYNVYRNGVVVGNTTETEYYDEIPYIDEFTYCVTALYEEGESECSNEVCLYIGSVGENLFKLTQVYPNPATDVVNIKSAFQIENVKVFNYNGQVVANETVNSTMYKVNTSQFNSGLYFFRIETTEGTISKRVIIE